jgi:hypothetical protein
MTTDLRTLGDALEHAVAADVGPRVVRRRRRRLAAFATVAVVAIPGVAFAAGAFTTSETVARSLPAGTKALIGTGPTCTETTAGVEYACTLETAPDGDVGAGHWKGTVEPTVDATNHVNGGCRSLAADGRTWTCYLGRAAVEQRIIGRDFLGAYASGPGAG